MRCSPAAVCCAVLRLSCCWQLAKKRVSLLATTLRTRPRPFKRALVDRFAREALPLLASGALQHLVHREFRGLEAAQEAHDLMESNVNSGKIVMWV